MNNQDHKTRLLKLVSEKELNEWLKRNPKPKSWEGNKYTWAHTEMPVGSFFTWWRRNVKGWKI